MGEQQTEKEKEEFKKKLCEFDFIRFIFADIHGISRGKLVPSRHARDIVEGGMAIFSGAQVFGPSNELYIPKRVDESNFENAFAIADLTTLHPVPWSGQGQYTVGQVLCDVRWADGEHQGCSSRAQASRQLKELEQLGFAFRSAFEFEMVMFQRDSLTPVTPRPYYCCMFPLQEFEMFMMDLDRNLTQVGVDIEAYHTEWAKGQFEMVMHHQPGIKAPDSAFLLKQGLKEIARSQGWDVNSMAIISPSQTGNGAHFNFSLWDKETGKNAFFDENEPDKISALARYWIGGVLKHCRALCALCCPTVNCYRRLHKPLAPDGVDWNFEDRMRVLRVKNYSASATYVENRLPSGLSNPYLVVAGTLAAGIDGIKNKIEAPAPCTSSLNVPYSLAEALTALEEDKPMATALGKEFIEWFVGHKREVDLKNLEKEFETDAEKLEAERLEYADLL